MRWIKLGKIFDPSEHKLPNGCVEFAQSPQALVFDDFVRIYFSTRAVGRATASISANRLRRHDEEPARHHPRFRTDR